jgi:hypothetical protein
MNENDIYNACCALFFPVPSPTMSFNATHVGSPAHLTASDLYATLNVDYTHLNWFEKNWMAWYLWIGNPVIATGIASFILHEVRFFSTHFAFRQEGFIFSPHSPSISVVAYPGSSSMPSHTSASGNCNLQRYQHHRSSGSAPRVFYFLTLLLKRQL